LKTHRDNYYRLLQEVRERGAWEAWLEFFLHGVAETANQASDAAGLTAPTVNAALVDLEQLGIVHEMTRW
jgi:Fic family protein